MKAAALDFAGVEEVETWGRPTFRVGKELFAAMHGELLILRSRPDDQEQRLADPRFQVAPYWGHNGWVAIDISKVRSDSELTDLLNAAWQLVGAKS